MDGQGSLNAAATILEYSKYMVLRTPHMPGTGGYCVASVANDEVVFSGTFNECYREARRLESIEDRAGFTGAEVLGMWPGA
jgi:hypothetical protein